MRFTDRMADSSGELWLRMQDHPFVREIGLGTLADERFIFYLRQDYVYLVEFCRLTAVAAAKAPDLETMTRFKDILKLIIEEEMDLHRTLCGRHGISPSELELTRPAPYCLAYTGYLLSTAWSGSFADLLAALLPCAWGYHEVGVRLKARGLPDVPQYREWIETYASPEMKELTDYLRSLIEREAKHAAEEKLVRWCGIFARSVEFEVMFWEMSYRKLDRVV